MAFTNIKPSAQDGLFTYQTDLSDIHLSTKMWK